MQTLSVVSVVFVSGNVNVDVINYSARFPWPSSLYFVFMYIIFVMCIVSIKISSFESLILMVDLELLMM